VAWSICGWYVVRGFVRELGSKKATGYWIGYGN
jgi:hypothetical protein